MDPPSAKVIVMLIKTALGKSSIFSRLFFFRFKGPELPLETKRLSFLLLDNFNVQRNALSRYEVISTANEIEFNCFYRLSSNLQTKAK